MANITDLTAHIQFRKIVYFDLDEYFDYVVTSEEAGLDKPNSASFKMLLEKLKINPDNIWIIGDCATSDIYGGNKVRMLTIQRFCKDLVFQVNQMLILKNTSSYLNFIKVLPLVKSIIMPKNFS